MKIISKFLLILPFTTATFLLAGCSHTVQNPQQDLNNIIQYNKNIRSALSDSNHTLALSLVQLKKLDIEINNMNQTTRPGKEFKQIEQNLISYMYNNYKVYTDNFYHMNTKSQYYTLIAFNKIAEDDTVMAIEQEIKADNSYKNAINIAKQISKKTK